MLIHNWSVPRFFVVVVFFAVAGFLAARAAAHTDSHNPARTEYLMQNGLPPEYQHSQNPLPFTAQDLGAGAALYQQHCALCHGRTGAGDGRLANQLEPPPPSLREMYAMRGMGMRGKQSHRQMMKGTMGQHSGMPGAGPMVGLDAYNFWAISVGGDPVGSSMPAFEDALTEKERWQIILFISNGFSTDASG